MKRIEYPVRINKYLYLKGFCSRRLADKLIEKGEVKINGSVAILGQKVNKGDKVRVSKKIEELPQRYKYYLFNKPVGVVSHNPRNKELGVENISGLGGKFFPVGRLDKESEGLMLLTNDGRIVDKMLNPKFGHEREYELTVNKRITDSALNRMQKGVNIEGYFTKQAVVKRIDESSFKIILTEGKKHQIRRMCSALGYSVKKLKRVRIMHLRLGSLQNGKVRELNKNETIKLLKSIGLR